MEENDNNKVVPFKPKAKPSVDTVALACPVDGCGSAFFHLLEREGESLKAVCAYCGEEILDVNYVEDNNNEGN